MKLLAWLSFGPLLLAQETFSGSAALDAQMEQAVRSGLIPGAVLLVGHDGKIVHRKAYGQRALVPAREAMTLDTIFDLASLTKLFIATLALQLVGERRLELDESLASILPQWRDVAQSEVTLRMLLAHTSGMNSGADYRAIANENVTELGRKSTRLNSSHLKLSRMPSSA